MKKKLKWIALAVVILVIVAVTAVILNLNGIVRSAVETGTTKSLELNTTLGGANIGLFSGDVSLDNLNIASPEGFSAPQMLSLGKVSVDTSYGKVFGKPTNIDDVLIHQPKLVLEFKGTQSNLKTVADRLMSGTGGDQPQPTPTDKAKEPLKLIIDHLKVSGAQVEIRSDMLLKEPILVTIPDIELSQIGNADGNRNGEEIGKVVSQVITRLSIEAQKSGKLPPELAQILSGDLDKLINSIGGKFEEQAEALKAQAMQQVDQLKGQAEQKIKDVQGQAQEKIKDVTGQLGGLLGGKKDEKKAEPKDP
jgi:ElaB/YqjD/DUF883 family membrane-anchored ribosome-binding protein